MEKFRELLPGPGRHGRVSRARRIWRIFWNFSFYRLQRSGGRHMLKGVTDAEEMRAWLR